MRLRIPRGLRMPLNTTHSENSGGCAARRVSCIAASKLKHSRSSRVNVSRTRGGIAWTNILEPNGTHRYFATIRESHQSLRPRARSHQGHPWSSGQRSRPQDRQTRASRKGGNQRRRSPANRSVVPTAVSSQTPASTCIWCVLHTVRIAMDPALRTNLLCSPHGTSETASGRSKRFSTAGE